VTRSDGALFVIDASGAIVAQSFGEGPLSAPAVARRVGIAVLRGRHLERWSMTGERLLTTDLEAPEPAGDGRRAAPPGPVIGRGRRIHAAPLGGQPVEVTDDGAIRRIDTTAIGDRSSISRNLGELTVFPGEMALADVAGDGGLDRLVMMRATDGTPVLGGWSIDEGAPLPAFPSESRLALPIQMVVVDLDADARFEVVFADDHQRLRAVNAGGLSPRGWPKLLPAPMAGGPAIGDLLGSGRWSVVALTTEGRLHAWRTEGPSTTAAPWEGPRHDLASTADTESPTRRRSEGSAASGCTSSGGSPLLATLVIAAWLARSRRRG
jgi:hypothetical protein